MSSSRSKVRITTRGRMGFSLRLSSLEAARDRYLTRPVGAWRSARTGSLKRPIRRARSPSERGPVRRPNTFSRQGLFGAAARVAKGQNQALGMSMMTTRIALTSTALALLGAAALGALSTAAEAQAVSGGVYYY